MPPGKHCNGRHEHRGRRAYGSSSHIRIKSADLANQKPKECAQCPQEQEDESYRAKCLLPGRLLACCVSHCSLVSSSQRARLTPTLSPRSRVLRVYTPSAGASLCRVIIEVNSRHAT